MVVNQTFSAEKMGEPATMGSSDYDCSYGVYGVFAVVVFFQILNLTIKCVGPPKSLRADEWKWRNLTISWLHALFCVSMCATSFITHTEFLWDLQHYESNFILFIITFSTGYFLYDFLDIVFSGMMFAMWEVQLHHIAVGGMFYYNIYNCKWLAFNIIALLVEVNSFFLHQRKLLQMMGTPYTSRLYRVTIFLNISTFVVFRSFPLAAILYAMSQWYNQVTLTYYVCITVAMIVMLVMNPILFMRLLRSDYLRPRRNNNTTTTTTEEYGTIHGKVRMEDGKVTIVNGNNNIPESIADFINTHHESVSNHQKQS